MSETREAAEQWLMAQSIGYYYNATRVCPRITAVVDLIEQSRAEGRAEGLKVLDAVDAYLSTAMWPTSIKNACGEGIWDRGRRSGLQEARNAIAVEREKLSAPAGLPPKAEGGTK